MPETRGQKTLYNLFSTYKAGVEGLGASFWHTTFTCTLSLKKGWPAKAPEADAWAVCGPFKPL